MAKRIFLFILTNIAFMITATLLLSITSIFIPSIYSDNISSVMWYSLIIGFSSALFSLVFSKPIAKWTTNTKIIKENQFRDEKQKLVFNIIKKLAQESDIKMPQVGIYEDETPNAFATGMTKNSALISFSTGLLYHMNENEIEGVAAHELAHIVNGDMITMTLIQGVVNTFIILVTRIFTNLAKNVDNVIISNPITLALLSIVLQIGLGILTSPIVCYFSRLREYRADKGSAELVGKEKMIAALEKLKEISKKENGVLEKNATMAAFGITENDNKSKLFQLFSTHPSLEKRISVLENMD